MVLKGKGGIQYNLETPPFAQGGEGLIFNIIGHPDKVAKLYKQGKVTSDHERKLIKMIMSPPSQDILDQIAWPLDVLYDNGQAAGFVMQKFKLNEDLNVIYEYGSSSKYPEITWSNKIQIAKNLCAVLNAVHEAGHVCGDFNPKNISLDPNTGCVTFVDTDSYHITDGKEVYRCNVGMAEYLPREIQVKMQAGLASAPLPTFSRETDNFALAIHIFQLLMNGCHPFACMVVPSADSVIYPDTSDSILKGECPFLANVPGKKIPVYAPPIDILPDEIQKLFKLAFIDGHASPSARPSAEAWYYALDRLEKNLKKCKKVMYHEYLTDLQGCPWCVVDTRFSSALSGNGAGLKQSAYTPVAPPVSSVPSPNGLNTKNLKKPKGRRGSVLKYAICARKKGIIIVGSVLILAVAAIWGINFYITDKKIANAESLISKLPATVSDYSYFEQEIMDAYTAYMELAPELQNRVENADKLAACMEEFNLYQTGLVRQTLEEVSAESVQNTDVLEKLHQLYGRLTAEQRALLTKDENQALEQASYAYVTIRGINALLGDVVGKYDTVSEIKKNYIRLTDYYRGLVYNYSELDTIDEMYNLQKSLDFSGAGGGWAVSVKADARNSLSGNIVIPSEYKGQPVTTIPEGAFSGCTGISSITVPDSVTGIGKKAFSGCLNLQSITLPFVGASRTAEGSEGIFGYIFGSDSYSGGIQICQWTSGATNSWPYIPSQLKEVTITDALQLSYGAFYGCSMLTAINLNSEIVGTGPYVFKGCSGIRTVNIPGITVIGESMFSGCSSLKTLQLGEEVMRIEKNAFKGCVNLESLNSEIEGDFVIGTSVQSIGQSAFSGCIKMKSITLPFVGASRSAEGSEGVFGYIFGSDSYSGGIQICQWTSGASNAWPCIPSQLKEVTITDAVQLSYGAFYDCSMLSRLTINSGAKNSVGSKAFKNCISPKWN